MRQCNNRLTGNSGESSVASVFGRRRRAFMRGVIISAAALVLALLGVLVPVKASPVLAAERCLGEVRSDVVRVAIVVDYGTVPGAPPSQSVNCLSLPVGSTGADLLSERASLLGTQRPRYNASGLMCAVDGFPTVGCGDMTDDGYHYWAYWTGTSGRWVYGGGNPFTRRLKDGDIEGWRFTVGRANPQDPPPRIAPDAGRLFPAVRPQVPPTTSTTLTGANPAPVAPGTGSPSGASVPNGTQGASTQASNPDGQVVHPGEVPNTANTSTTHGEQGEAVAGDVAGSGGDAVVGDDSSDSPGEVDLAMPPGEGGGFIAVNEVNGGDSRSPLIGIAAGGVIAIAIGIAAVVRFRREQD